MENYNKERNSGIIIKVSVGRAWPYQACMTCEIMCESVNDVEHVSRVSRCEGECVRRSARDLIDASLFAMIL
eukprot:3861382-Rhodomonas_salina.2